MKAFSIVVSTLFGIGYVPFIPGTVSSAVAALAIIVWWPEQLTTQLIITGAVFIAGIITSGYSAAYFNRTDPKQIVIDEVSGMTFSMLFITPDPITVVAAFLLFRFFDISKLPGIRRIERLPGGYGIMMDDVLAGIYTNICLHVIRYFT